MHKVALASLSLFVGFLSLSLHAAAPPLPSASSQKVDFAKDIQPLFAAHCYECHGPKKQEAQFRLDVKDVALKGGELGLAILPGKSADSLLIQAVAGLKPDLIMPRKGPRLTSQQIALLRAWIDQGADWPANASVVEDDGKNHWGFKPPVRPTVPPAKPPKGGNPYAKWPRNPIDNFILARLQQDKLRPSPEADRTTLLRRVSLDLTGLPPTIQEVKDFLADRRPDAYERAVERLLDSPHYGEKWGRLWLDLARYADTNGYEKDKPRSIWPYRDWVIRALNRDMPYDQFTIEQLAGDLLPRPTLDQRVATGFLRNAMQNQEGGIEPEQFRVEALVDRMDTLGKTFLGLTINCCQCHHHKYDPFSQKDYYQFYAFLNNDDESFTEVATAAQTKKRQEILRKIRELELNAMNEITNLDEKLDAWQKASFEITTNWTVLEPKDWHNFATKFEKQEDGSLLGGGDVQPGGVMHVSVETTLTNITAFRLEALTNPNLMYGGPGLLGKGSFLVREFSVEAYALTNATVTNQIKFRRALADEEAPGFSVTNAIDGITNTGGWTASVTPDRRNQNHAAVFECEEPVGFPEGTRFQIAIYQKFEKEKDVPGDKDSKLEAHMLGCFRLSATTNPVGDDVTSLTRLRAQITGQSSDTTQLTTPQTTNSPRLALFDEFRLSDPACSNLNAEINKLWADWPYPPTTLVLRQRPHSRTTHIFKRGDRLRPGDEVEPDVPGFLNPFPSGAPRNRLGLAKWLVDPRNPTVARVMVNRIWQAYFGQGFVTTPEDFGTRAESPSHPELLDWLACELMAPTKKQISNSSTLDFGRWPLDSATPWSLKHIHRLLVTSATYRQSSRASPELYAKDPYNRLIARGPRFRVEAETVEDIALFASGLLNPKIGGPSIYPPIPASVGDTVYGGFTWPETRGDERHRRALYTFCKRSLPFPSLSVFDAPSGEISCPRRVRSNTPLQALTTLNEKTFLECAQALALRTLKDGGADNRARLDYAFELCTGRKPDRSESAKLLKFWNEQFDYFENRTASAVSVAAPEPANMPPDVNLHKAAAWAMVARVILNLDETMTKE